MAEAIQVSGVVTWRVDAGDGLETLGYSVDQPSFNDRAFYDDVHGDEHGGPSGPPIDVQYLGRVVSCRAQLSKYDKAVLNKLRTRVQSGGAANAGTISAAQIGDLMIQDSKEIRVLLLSANDPYNFPICLMRDPIELSLGTKHSELMIEFEAHRNQTTGVLYNTTTS